DGKKPSPTNANNTHGLCEMVRSFKHYVTRNINELNPNRNFKWHRSFNDRIIRNEKELYYIRQYICNNPKNW
ncbi:MAG: transposase, partial [Candidatus Delongbacteria bacterium]|nr:transposase [Candidatus Delongbacteria bacterium]